MKVTEEFLQRINHGLETVPGFFSSWYNLIGRQLESVSASVTELNSVRVYNAFGFVVVVGSDSGCDIYIYKCTETFERQ